MGTEIGAAKKPAVFFDRDGTLNRDVGYVTHLDLYELLPRAAAAVRKVNEAGWLAILITNQAGVARGYFPEIMIDKVHRKLQEELGGKGARLDAIYYCPHVPNGDDPVYALDCQMRKPYPGMILKAAAEHGVDLKNPSCWGTSIPIWRQAGVRVVSQALCSQGMDGEKENFAVRSGPASPISWRKTPIMRWKSS